MTDETTRRDVSDLSTGLGSSSDIWRERLLLEKAHSEFQAQAMNDYNRTVYHPALKLLRARCAEIGHRPQDRWHDNGIGWRWRYCNQCGERVDISGPDA
jgi:hypothetical protein